MADILIRGISMPREDTFCIVHIYGDGTVCMPAWGKGMKKVDGVEAISVPPHGRLIDQDAILREVIRGDYPNQWIDKNELLRLFRNASTVIPASEVKNNG